MTNSEIDRRSVVSAAVWATPVIAAAVAVPLAAASPGGGTIEVGGPWIDERASDGWIAQGIVFTLKDAAGRPVEGREVVFSLQSGNGPFFLVDDPDFDANSAVAQREIQRLTRNLYTDASGRVELNDSGLNGYQYGYIRKGLSSAGETSSILTVSDPNSGEVLATAVLRLGGTDRGIKPGF